MTKTTTKKKTAEATETKKAITSFSRWNKNRTPITNENHETIVIPQDEVFVAIYDFKAKKPRKKYYISNIGRVVSFHDWDKPIERKIDNSTKYSQIKLNGESKNLAIHRLVFFSFLYDYLFNPKTEVDKLTIMSFGVDIKATKETFIELLNGRKYDVHHINTNERDNRLENLLLLPKEIHDILTQMSRKDDSERYEYFAKNTEKFRNKDKMIVVEIEQDRITGGVKGVTVGSKLRSNIKILQVVRTTLEINEPSIEEMTDFLKKLKEQIQGIKGTNYFDTKKYIIFFNDTDKERIWVYSIFKDVIEKVNLYEYHGEFDISYNYLTNIYYISD